MHIADNAWQALHIMHKLVLLTPITSGLQEQRNDCHRMYHRLWQDASLHR